MSYHHAVGASFDCDPEIMGAEFCDLLAAKGGVSAEEVAKAEAKQTLAREQASRQSGKPTPKVPGVAWLGIAALVAFVFVSRKNKAWPQR